MQKTCAISGQSFEISEQDLKLYEKLEAPLPTLCPGERHRRKMAFRNEQSLFRRACSLCGAKVISVYSEDAPYTVYCNKCWWGDKWDPLEYGQDFDFKRPFFEQFKELADRVPKCALDNFDHENSDYCNYSCHNKDCYMLFGTWFNERCMYANTILYSLELMDVIYCNKCKYGYELIDCDQAYQLFFAQNCNNCSDSYFLFDCRNCQNCIFCWNLRNKEYHVMNKPVSKEEFEKMRDSFLGSYEKLQAAFAKFQTLVRDEAIHKYMIGENNENATGNFLHGCKNVDDLFYGLEAEDVRHSIRTTKHQMSSMDINGNSAGELMYDSIHCDFCHRGKFDWGGEHNADFEYCWICYQNEYLFGCIGLQHKKHCILNKQYTKESFDKLRTTIIEHMSKTVHPETKGPEWGEFFPMLISPFAYNETVAQEYFPLTEEEVVKRGLKWKKEEVQSGGKPVAIPDKIEEVEDAICEAALTCEECGKGYRIDKQELKFYKKYRLAVPRECFKCRHLARMGRRAPYRMFARPCVKCGKELQSSYAPERKEKVYCEECYLGEVV